MKRTLLVFLVFISLVSCYRTAKDPAFEMDKVLPADSMISLLVDLHLVDGIIDNLKEDNQQTGHLSSEYFTAVLEKHKLDKEDFEESMRYYAYYTEKLDKIYEKVIINLSKKESLMITPKEAEEKLP